MSHPDFVPNYRLGPTDRITFDGIAYRLRQRLSHGYVLARADDPGVLEEFSNARFHALTMRPDYRFERGAYDLARLKVRHDSDAELLTDIPSNEHEEVLWRYLFCKAFLKLEDESKATRSDRAMKAAILSIHANVIAEAEIKARKRNADGDPIPHRAGDPTPSVRRAPSPRTLRTWLKRLELAGMRATALRKHWRLCGDRVTQRYSPDEQLIMSEFAVLYAAENRPSIRDVHRSLKAEIVVRNKVRANTGLAPMRVPSYARFTKEVRSLPEFDVYAGRYGLPAAMKRFAMVANGPDVERPLQRVEIDEWRVNLLTICQDAGIFPALSDSLQKEIDTVRPWLCVAMDAASRVILGMKLGLSASSELALETLEMVVSSKKPFADAAGSLSAWDFCGSPETVAHDQGASFLSVAFRRAVIDLEAEPDAPPAGLPHLRGRIERVFRTAGTQAVAPFTGRTFESITAKGDYNPQERVSLEIQELCRALVRWVVDIYHNSPHAGLGGETPANAWRRLVLKYGVIAPPDRHVRRAIFGIGITRVLSSRGVRVQGLFYNCHELQKFRRDRGDADVEVRLDSLDLGHVSVRLGDAGWLAVPCMRPGFDDVTVQTWRLAAADLRRRFAAEARLNDDIIAAAIRDSHDLAAKAQAREGILSTRPTREQLDHEEEKLGIGFPAPEGQAASVPAMPLSTDLLERAIPTRKGTAEALPKPAEPKRTRTVRFED